LFEGHGHDPDDKGWGNDKISMLGLNDEGVGEELLVADVDAVMTVNVLIEETLELTN
jgi:hypothetical protein